MILAPCRTGGIRGTTDKSGQDARDPYTTDHVRCLGCARGVDGGSRRGAGPSILFPCVIIATRPCAWRRRRVGDIAHPTSEGVQNRSCDRAANRAVDPVDHRQRRFAHREGIVHRNPGCDQERPEAEGDNRRRDDVDAFHGLPFRFSRQEAAKPDVRESLSRCGPAPRRSGPGPAADGPGSRTPSSPRPPAPRGCRRKGRGGPW